MKKSKRVYISVAEAIERQNNGVIFEAKYKKRFKQKDNWARLPYWAFSECSFNYRIVGTNIYVKVEK